MAIIPAPKLDRHCGTCTHSRRTKWTEWPRITSINAPQEDCDERGRFLEKPDWPSCGHINPATSRSSIALAKRQRFGSKDPGDHRNCHLLRTLLRADLLAADSIRWVNGRVARRLRAGFDLP